MFVALLFIQLFIIGIGAKNPSIDCPTTCPLNLYEPVCSGGISYSSSCALKQEICKGNLDEKVFTNIEPCPKYSKEKDAKSAVAVDHNGVILRTSFRGESSSSSEED
ncbi:hypothetical protein PV327_009912 [Microctonus hyperodae]|uniref:Kazal-like domain-containing protein n=1 Tax=Microctonus hyperodae TaxID=165561 RepID=A0AA39KGD9_MICHY|nr:hypothetical protein PV327_009912 [Microctonus hyperodae]